ncbi:MAG: hypothetical protein KOO66_01750 [Bacteroidales bacterium]|nr:hypothetical protein [Bacteroidales bacterium]
MINSNTKSKLIVLLFIVFSSCITEDIERQILITTGDAIEIQVTKARLQGQIIDFGEGIDQYGHCWSTNRVPTIINDRISIIDHNTNGEFISRIDNLNENTPYYYRSYAKRGSNVNYGAIESFKTRPYGIPIVELGVLDVSYETVSGFVKLAYLGYYEQIEEIGVCWSEITFPTIKDSKFSFAEVDSIGIYTFDMTNLKDGQQYYLRAYAKYDKGIYYSRGARLIYTKELRTPEILINSIKDISNSSFTVNVEIIDFGGDDSIESYGVCWGETQNLTIESNVVYLGSTSVLENQDVIINDLNSLKKYYVKAFVINDKGIGYSSSVPVQTSGNVLVSSGIIAYYTFNGSSLDYSDNQNHATNYGAELTADRFGNPNSAYDFDGLVIICN